MTRVQESIYMFTMPSHLRIQPIPALDSNYIWMIEHPNRQQAYIVDPGEPGPVLDYVKRTNNAIQGILVTHSHKDHIGGILDLLGHFQVPVIGPKSERIPMITKHVAEGDRLRLWPGCEATVMEVPGHLPEHIIFSLQGELMEHPSVLCGDILFSSGCGRMFIGTPEEFNNSLQRVCAFAPETLLYCSHEYTLANIDFSEYVEPDNDALKAKRLQAKKDLGSRGCTLPTSVAQERLTNPFCRTSNTTIKRRIAEITGTHPTSDSEVFAALRRLKDHY